MCTDRLLKYDKNNFTNMFTGHFAKLFKPSQIADVNHRLLTAERSQLVITYSATFIKISKKITKACV